MVEITHETRGDVLILKPTKRIDSANAKAFEDEANAKIDSGSKKVVIDFSGLDYISSAGLRVVLTTAKRVKAAGGGLALCGVHGNVKEVFDVSGFASVLGMHAGIDEAIASLKG